MTIIFKLFEKFQHKTYPDLTRKLRVFDWEFAKWINRNRN
ncbi:MAG: hypothetical protein JWR38_277 [Mucilaginibacter sp.]|nr:hypothetical protein [Mucilaginibacter sp.]